MRFLATIIATGYLISVDAHTVAQVRDQNLKHGTTAPRNVCTCLSFSQVRHALANTYVVKLPKCAPGHGERDVDVVSARIVSTSLIASEGQADQVNNQAVRLLPRSCKAPAKATKVREGKWQSQGGQ